MPITLYPAQVTQSGTWTVDLPANAAQEAGGNLEALQAAQQQEVVPLLLLIISELRVHRVLLAEGLNVRIDSADIADIYSTTPT